MSHASETVPPPLTHPTSELRTSSRRFRHRGEAVRERDVFKYLHPWIETYRSDLLRRPAFHHPQDRSKEVPETPLSLPTAPAQTHALPASCPDTALSAFAQLGAWRLQARRCLVTLLSATDEFVLADISQTASLQQNVPDERDVDAPWIGTSWFSKNDGLTAEACGEWQKAKRAREPPSDAGFYYTEGASGHWQIISDARTQSSLQERAVMKHGRWIRFIASVPLRSPQGSVLGSLTVLDDKPRYGLSAGEIAILEDLSDTVAEHLEVTLVRAQHRRNDRLVHGLELFNVGGDSLRDWWLSQDDARVLSTGRNVDKGNSTHREERADAEFGRQDAYFSTEQMDGTVAQVSAVPSLASKSNSFLSNSSTGGQTKRAPRRRSHAKQNHVSFNEPNLADLIAGTYAKACNILREAMNADGMFFIKTNSMTTSLRCEDSESTGRSGSPPEGSQGSAGDTEASDNSVESSDPCQIQSFSTRTRSSVAGHDAQSQKLHLTEPQLRRLIKLYPRGTVLYLSARGDCIVSSDEDSSQSDKPEENKKRAQKKDAKVLSRAIQGARALIFYPLWDHTLEAWRSCGLLWSNSTDRILDQTEALSYLRTFSHSILAELTRVEMVASDKAKGTFISSISHELRSPLHGILAGVEFLHDTELTSFQEEMVEAINGSSSTLLDTVNHVLDYSKISNFVKAAKNQSSSLKTSGVVTAEAADAGSNRVEDEVDLALLTERVVETCVVAHRSKTRPAGPIRSSSGSPGVANSSSEGSKTTILPAEDVSVTLTISHQDNWMVRMQPGAWTRILTNLLGNALKYTHEGSIDVQLVTKPLSREEGGASEGHSRVVELGITDTGIGISESFLAHGLFRPFKQEDQHSVGTGLGLSIVKQIADSIGAELKMTSEQGRGTRAVLTFQIVFASTEGPTAEDAKWTSNLKVDQFRLFSSQSSEAGSSTHGSADLAVARSIIDNVEAWLGCTVVENNETAPDVSPAICAITQTCLDAWFRRDSQSGLAEMLSRIARQYSHLLVLSTSVQHVRLPEHVLDRLPLPVIFVHQPIGPRKLLKAIASDRSSTVAGEANAADSTPPTSPYTNQAQRRSIHAESFAASPSSRDRPERNFRPSMASPESSSAISMKTVPTSASLKDQTSEVTGQTQTSEADSELSSEARPSVPATSESADQDSEDKVLLVEDNELNMRFLVTLMEKLDVPYECATNGREAVDLFRRKAGGYSLILMDMSMPVMDGFVATSKIRETESRRGRSRAYVVALTGVTSPEAKTRAFDCGIDEFYPKPVRMLELKQLLTRLRSSS